MDEKEKEKQPATDTGEGVQSETDKKVDELNADTERINKAVQENEDAKSRAKLGGVTEGGTETTPKFSDEEKASRARIKAVGEASGSKWAKDYE